MCVVGCGLGWLLKKPSRKNQMLLLREGHPKMNNNNMKKKKLYQQRCRFFGCQQGMPFAKQKRGRGADGICLTIGDTQQSSRSEPQNQAKRVPACFPRPRSLCARAIPTRRKILCMVLPCGPSLLSGPIPKRHNGHHHNYPHHGHDNRNHRKNKPPPPQPPPSSSVTTTIIRKSQKKNDPLAWSPF